MTASTWNILVEPTPEGQMMATVLELPMFQVVAATQQVAIELVRQRLVERLAQAKIIPLQVETPQPVHPMLQFAGIFKDDPDFAEIMAQLQAERAQPDDA